MFIILETHMIFTLQIIKSSFFQLKNYIFFFQYY